MSWDNCCKPKLFFPLNWFNHVELASNRPNSYWNDQFQESFLVHYYESSSRGKFHGKGFPSVRRPNYYAKDKPALVYLGPMQCPLSFYSVKNSRKS